jgi:hypothetical protein
VVPLRFDRARIQALLELAGERLTGEWLLIGGAAAAAWFAPVRTTEDIDLIGLGGSHPRAPRRARLRDALGA